MYITRFTIDDTERKPKRDLSPSVGARFIAPVLPDLYRITIFAVFGVSL
jgi:hypothetical protein